MAVETVRQLFEYELNEIYGVEQAMIGALESMARDAVLGEIRHAYHVHEEQTRTQLARLDAVFRALGSRPRPHRLPAIDGLIAEREMFRRAEPRSEVAEMFDLNAAQKAERYEITAYEALVDLAERLGAYESVALLEETLRGEEAALHQLQFLASDYDKSGLIDREPRPPRAREPASRRSS